MIDHDAIRILGDIPAAQAAARGGQVALACEGARPAPREILAWTQVRRRELRAPCWRGHARAVG